MNHYEQKQQARRERYEELAEKNQAASEASFQGSRDATAGIPFGQPILVGHHSEGRHRSALKRSDDRMRKGCELADKAKYYAGKAAGVGKAGISSDDPEAVTKLQAKIDSAIALQGRMKATNKVIKSKKLTEAEKITQLDEQQGISEFNARLLMEPDFCGRIGFPSYELTNNNANIRRMKLRIEELRQAPTETTEEQRGDVTVIHNTEENRIQLVFPGKPSAEIRSVLKSNGFRWSRYNTAWQRHLNNAGIYAAEQVLTKIKAIT